MNYFMTAASAILLAAFAQGGEVYDLGERKSVPNWAIGPLLVVPVERVEDGHLKAARSETTRIGTVQSNYLELDSQRHRLASIRLFEVPNDGYRCKIDTVPKAGFYFEINLSQSLYDRTFYYVYIQKKNASDDEALEKRQFAVWDIKSRG